MGGEHIIYDTVRSYNMYCKADGVARRGQERKINMMLQYLPVIHTTTNRATPPDGDRK